MKKFYVCFVEMFWEYAGKFSSKFQGITEKFLESDISALINFFYLFMHI